MDRRTLTCCFTGHRNIKANIVPVIMKRTEEAIRTLIGNGVIYYNVGGAVGYDTLAAELLFRLKETEFPQIQIILMYPFDGFTATWDDEDRERYARLLPKYDSRICVAQKATREAYLLRDRCLVDSASYCISYCTRRSGGTAYTVRYAQKQNVMIIETAQL